METILHLVQIIFINCLLLGSSIGKVTVLKQVVLESKFATLVGTKERFSTTSRPSQAVDYYAFRAVPYAEPPVGKLRWKDPILAQPEGTLLNATVDKNACPQWTSLENGTSVLIGDEDCLYFSIFIPERKSEQPLKFIVFFHGGGFIINSNRNTMPIPLLEQGNCIIVMFNYRLTIFGYLSTGSPQLGGNFSFLDQIAVLKFIQMYGKDFGGDPNDVTIMGSSIGGVSIHFLLLSKLAKGLFHKAIIESGSAFSERSLVPNPLEITMNLGENAGCPDINNEELLVKCLRSKSTTELMAAAKHLCKKWVLPSILGPVIDRYSRPINEQFLPDFPENLPIANKVPVIVGITANEGLTAFVKLSKEFNEQQLNNLEFIRRVILPHYLNLIMRSRKNKFYPRHVSIQNLANEILDFYRQDFYRDPIRTLTDILGDIWVTSSHRKTMEHLCLYRVPSVYAYLFTHHDVGVSPSEIDTQIQAFHEAGIEHPILDRGVAHTEEVLYMLSTEAQSRDGGRLEVNARNHRMSILLSTIWQHFALYGSSRDWTESIAEITKWPNWNPVCFTNSSGSFHDPDYPLYEISLDNHRIFRNYRLKEIEFWWRKHLNTINFDSTLRNQIGFQ